MPNNSHAVPSKARPIHSPSLGADQVSFSPNFAQPRSPRKYTQGSPWQIPIQYEHEMYLQLTSGDSAAEKTANQRYMEERDRRLKCRAQDLAVSGPQNMPSPVDFECAQLKNRALVEKPKPKLTIVTDNQLNKRSPRTPKSRSPAFR